MAKRTNPETALVLGADIEGMAAAITLASAGKRVTVIDRCEAPGGACAPREIHAGHTVPGLLHETELACRSLLASLGLEKHGLTWRDSDVPLHVLGSGAPFVLRRDPAQCTGLGADNDAYVEWRAWMDRLSGLIVDVLDDAPPEAEAPGLGEMLRLAKKGLKLRTLGDRDMMELLRIVTMPAWDWTEERFESDVLRTAVTAPVLGGTVVGPRAAGTTAMILMREAARGVEPIGGTAAIVDALAKRCRELGVEFVLGRTPTEIVVDQHAATGVRFDDGDTIDAALVLSAWDAKRTLVELVDPAVLPHDVEAEARFWRTRGSTAVHLVALSQTGALPSGVERWITASTSLQLERTADALKYGALPEAPWLDVRVWSDSAPSGAATLSIHVHGVPHELRASDKGWDAGARAQLKNRILGALEEHAPGVRDAIVADELLVPADLESAFGLSGGHLYGGEIALDQLWVQRPALALCRYATPIAGLWLGGASSHPGGAFLGGAGVLGARAALRG